MLRERDADLPDSNFGSCLRSGGETPLDNGLTGIGYLELALIAMKMALIEPRGWIEPVHVGLASEAGLLKSRTIEPFGSFILPHPSNCALSTARSC